MEISEIRASLENANIVRLLPAARMAGLSFRNGLTKAEIVRALEEKNLMVKAWGILQNGVMTQSQTTAQTQTTARPAQTPQEYLEELAPLVAYSAPTPPPKPVPAPQAAPALPALPGPTSQAEALQALIQSIAGASVDKAQVRAIATEVARAIAREELAAAPQGTVIHLPPLPDPIQLEQRQHAQFGDLLLCLQQGLNVYLVGQASSGKTHAAESAAKALSRTFYAQGAITYAHELLGYVDAMGKYVRTQFRDAFEKGGLMLLDEFDASSAEAALVVNAALANGFCAFPDGMITRHSDFLCVVGANTDGSGATMQYSGRARLDGAFLDRFVQIDWKIDPVIETGKAKGNKEWLDVVRAVRKFIAERKIHDVAATVRAVDFGSTLLAAGMNRARVLEMTMKRGALVKEWDAILRLSEVSDFLLGF